MWKRPRLTNLGLSYQQRTMVCRRKTTKHSRLSAWCVETAGPPRYCFHVDIRHAARHAGHDVWSENAASTTGANGLSTCKDRPPKCRELKRIEWNSLESRVAVLVGVMRVACTHTNTHSLFHLMRLPQLVVHTKVMPASQPTTYSDTYGTNNTVNMANTANTSYMPHRSPCTPAPLTLPLPAPPSSTLQRLTIAALHGDGDEIDQTTANIARISPHATAARRVVYFAEQPSPQLTHIHAHILP